MKNKVFHIFCMLLGVKKVKKKTKKLDEIGQIWVWEFGWGNLAGGTRGGMPGGTGEGRRLDPAH